MVHAVLESVTNDVIERSKETRNAYLQRIDDAASQNPSRGILSCGNLAHGFAACGADEKADLSGQKKANVAIISAYNDMLSAHQPFEPFPEIIKNAARDAGGVAQFAGGVPAMCDGITQGQPGMDLSLFSRDVIAMATAVGLSHNMFDAAMYLGVCDKIVPGLLMGALSFGHLPAVFVPAGPMPSGLPNKEKIRIRQLFAEGKVGRDELLKAESESYHSPGTCTFYGTANSNQMMMEMMGLHLPGGTFINPNTPMRDELTAEATRQILSLTSLGEDYRPVGKIIDEKAIINAMVGLLATGGSTNHTIHLVAIARVAGIQINWNDFDKLSAIIPSLTRIYPNGTADVNHFNAAGGLGLVIRELCKHGLMHEDITTIGREKGMQQYTQEPRFEDGKLNWVEGPEESQDPEIISTVEKPFAKTGGLTLMRGNLGRGVSKISAVDPEHQIVEAPAMVFDDQNDVVETFKRGEMDQDVIVVLRFQGPKANGMPELHKVTSPLGVLQDRGYKVALITDGRMSGASGKVPSAIHLSPECLDDSNLTKVQNGDMIYLNTQTGELTLKVDDDELAKRKPAEFRRTEQHYGTGRELFTTFRAAVSTAETGAVSMFNDG